ncbi:hypothetical protein ACFOY8_12050 [Thalassospira xianhensis]|uniref:Uncharacterized protein n=1 Tax=Thalassospira xianhensis MCCC 1A02616 TaxID=1177929 RepID=A0A367U8B7_9PROT|nr:hypothetical protein [Thalassospira xianhensis]RCK04160.1 hypothetical protein TH5_21545 [Thalassospira xianhensis MCCC 1A02616]
MPGGKLKKTVTTAVKRRRLDVHGDRDVAANKIGEVLSKALIAEIAKLPLLNYRVSLRRSVFSRMTREEVLHGKKFRKFRPDKDMNRVFRAAEKNQDELFSTALTRNIVKGFRLTEMAKDPEAFNLLVDLMSAIRISTSHSGYSLKTETMQHPTQAKSGLFDDPDDTASNHAFMDARRRAYVTRAMNEAIDAKLPVMDIAKAGLRAAIEYTLNHFTAPITADDVFPHSRLKKVLNASISDPKAKAQLRSREEMKGQYERLGGVLRLAIPGETNAQSVTRNWRRDGTTPLQGDDVAIEPPSPRRFVA